MTETLAKEIKVSRTPVRDALRKLEADGLVTIRAHEGASVKQMQLKEFHELCDLRLALESHAARLAAVNRTENDLHEIRFALEAMRQLTDFIITSPKTLPALSKLANEDVRFHIAIISAAKNELMKKEILRLHIINRVLSQKDPPAHISAGKADSDDRRRAIMTMHDNIFNAIERSDRKAAKRQMEFHLQELIDYNLRMMSRAEMGGLARELTADEKDYKL